MIQPLNLNERKEAISLISNNYFDTDVIAAVRSLLRKKAEERRLWKIHLEQHFPPHKVYAGFSGDSTSELDDTKPFMPLENDGD